MRTGNRGIIEQLEDRWVIRQLVFLFKDAVAILEGTWTTFHTGVSTGPIVYGEKGTLVVDGGKLLIYTERKSKDPSAVYEGEPLPENRDSIAKEFIHHLETGEPLHTVSPEKPPGVLRDFVKKVPGKFEFSPKYRSTVLRFRVSRRAGPGRLPRSRQKARVPKVTGRILCLTLELFCLDLSEWGL